MREELKNHNEKYPMTIEEAFGKTKDETKNDLWNMSTTLSDKYEVITKLDGTLDIREKKDAV